MQGRQAVSQQRRWPKRPVELTPEEESLRRKITRHLQEFGYRGVLGWVQSQGHVALERLSRPPTRGRRIRTLEIGCGSGHHLRYVEPGGYVALDCDIVHLKRARRRHPDITVLCGDAYQLPFATSSFDRVLSVYVFEHLRRLPDSLAEVDRVLKAEGELLIGLPTEGGLAYSVGRRLTTKRHIERAYEVDYLKVVRAEHCNTCREVMDEVARYFCVTTVRYLPFRFRSIHANAIVVMRCVSDAKADAAGPSRGRKEVESEVRDIAPL